MKMQFIIPNNRSASFVAQDRIDVCCIAHRHIFSEWIYVEDGELTVVLDGKKADLRKGESVFVMPFQSHEFITRTHSHSHIFTFLTDICDDFSVAIRGKLAKAPVFTISDTLARMAIGFHNGEENDFKIKAFLYPLCYEILNKCDFVEHTGYPETAVIKAMNYMIDNYDKPITLLSTANALGYSSKYLSGAFSRSAEMNFTDYLNNIRCSYAIQRLCNTMTDEPISSIALDSGFGSIRSFNRIFKKYCGTTPKEMRSGL